MSRTPQFAFLLAVLGVIAAGCSSPADGPASPAPSSAGPSSGPALPSTAPSTPPPSTVVPSSPGTSRPATAKPGSPVMLPLDFTRTGGFAGFNDHLTIAADGTVTVKRRGAAAKSTPLGATKLAELKRLLADPALTGLTQPPDGPGSVCSDGFVYRFLTPSWTQVLDDCGGPNPPAVERLLRFVAPLL